MNRRISISLLAIASMLSAGALQASAESVMTRHVRQATLTGQARLVGHLPASQVLQLDIVLPIRDQAGLDIVSRGLVQLQRSQLPALPHSRRVHRKIRPHPARLRRRCSIRPVPRTRRSRRIARWHGSSGQGPRFSHRVGIPCQHADLPASHREPHFLRPRPRTHHRSGHSRFGIFRASTIFRFRIRCL